MNLATALLDVARRHATDEALVDGPVRLDYAAVVRQAGAVAAGLAGLGVEPGDRVAILLPNGWHYAVCYFGVQLSGAVAVLVNTRLTGTEIEHVLRDSGARLVLTDDLLGGRLAPGSPARPVRAADLAAARTEPRALPGAARQPDDVAQLLYTSGTTGRPKGAMQTHANLLANARTVRDRLGAAPGERTLVVAPMFHATGTASQLVGFCAAGACCVFVPEFHAATALSLLPREGITVFVGVAAMLRLMLLRAGAAELSALRLCVLGGSPVPANFPAEVRRRVPELVLANVWGLTEATSIVTYVEGEEYLAWPWSVGRAVPGVELAVAGAGEEPRDVRDRVGELCVRGPTVTAGYWGDRVATGAAFADGWLHTGDVGSIDADGHVRLLDRLKDMIIRGGENIYSLEVESALAAHPDIAEVAVVGVPDPILDERVRAFVVLRPGATPTAEALRSHAATLLADFKIPAEFRFVDALPHNGSGKVLKRRLTAEA
ncbi:MAG: fatty-acid--CoA ligase [Mycobacterium sp.]|nr:fatty-acid--CoA ligase [Mycobacterium sp.]